jgi:hypothetical protein
MRLYLGLTFWGEEYRRYFVDFCLASLLAPGNIPAIRDKSSARLLLATTDGDWAELQTEPLFLVAKTLIPVEHVPFASGANWDARMGSMSEGHRLLAQRMFADRAQGVFLHPDMVASTGYLESLQRLWGRGFAAIMFMAVRFTNEGALNEINASRNVPATTPLSFSPNELVRLILRHMHSEMQRGEFDKPFYDYGCSFYFWKVGRGADLVLHCGSWVPALMDYARLAVHDDSSLETDTLDGDYVNKNFSDERDFYYSHDTDELLFISFTPESSQHYSLAPLALYRLSYLRSRLKIVGAHNFLYAQAPDWLKEKQFRLPVRFHGGDSTEEQWRAAEARSAGIIGCMRHGGNLFWKLAHFFYFRFVPIVASLWPNRKVIARRFFDILRGDRAAWDRVRWRMRHQVTGEARDVWKGRHDVAHKQ